MSDRGVPCPKCRSTYSRVRNTYRLASGAIRRRRVCQSCSRSFFTLELPAALVKQR